MYKKSKEDDFSEAKNKFTEVTSLQKQISQRETEEAVSQFLDKLYSVLDLIKSRVKIDIQEMKTGVSIF